MSTGVDAKCRVSLHEPPRYVKAAGVSYVPVGSALIDMPAGGDAGGRAPTSTVGTSSFAGVNVKAKPAMAITVTAPSPAKTHKTTLVAFIFATTLNLFEKLAIISSPFLCALQVLVSSSRLL